MWISRLDSVHFRHSRNSGTSSIFFQRTEFNFSIPSKTKNKWSKKALICYVQNETSSFFYDETWNKILLKFWYKIIDFSHMHEKTWDGDISEILTLFCRFEMSEYVFINKILQLTHQVLNYKVQKYNYKTPFANISFYKRKFSQNSLTTKAAIILGIR